MQNAWMITWMTCRSGRCDLHSNSTGTVRIILINEEILSKVKIIDLSADFRIKDVKTYEKWYGIEHKSPQFIEEAVYGLCEINREDITKARLIANPGCYTTCSILTAYPLAKEGLIDMDTLIIDAKSGTSGAGRGS